MKKPTLFSGIQPSGIIHIGNYLGALSQWQQLQHDYTSYFSVVDLHAITVSQNPAGLSRATLNTAKMLIAIGIDPDTLFVQSHVPAHTQLYWLLNTITKVSELELMTQYKDKAARVSSQSAGAGLLNYPVLMAADILLYQTSVVPVGEDQTQHIELARELARRFNRLFGETFVEPKALIQSQGRRVMGLDDPTQKMSKSATSEKNYIALTDTPAVVEKKIMTAVTDSGSSIHYNFAKQPGISNLLELLAGVSSASIKELEDHYEGRSYGDLKHDTANAINAFLAPIQQEFSSLSDSSVKKTLIKGSERATKTANKTLEAAHSAMGLL